MSKRETISAMVSRLADALDDEHNDDACNNNACDITAASRHGYYLWAALLLTGATDCPKTEAAYARLRARCRTLERRLEDERVKLLEEDHRECPGCNAIVWESPDDDTSCGNCGADLPAVKAPVYHVVFGSHSGMTFPVGTGEPYDSLPEAWAAAGRYIARRETTGHRVVKLPAAHAWRETMAAWEVSEPEGSALVPDTAGILVIREDKGE